MKRSRTAYFEAAANGARSLPQALGASLCQTCTLPWPPSVNQLAKVDRRGRRSYRDEAILALRAQRLRAYERGERVAVRIWCYAPDQQRRDLDNLAKAPLDALEKGGYLVDDQQVDDLRLVRRTPDPAMPRLEVSLALLVESDVALVLVDELERDALDWIRYSDYDPELLKRERARVQAAAQKLRTKIGGAP